MRSRRTLGRGGWTWYTGSAGWMYRLLIETLLGVNLEGDQLRLAPRLPKTWTDFKIHYRYRQTVYHITIARLAENAAGANSLTLDGLGLSGDTIPLRDDHHEHVVEMKVRWPDRPNWRGDTGLSLHDSGSPSVETGHPVAPVCDRR